MAQPQAESGKRGTGQEPRWQLPPPSECQWALTWAPVRGVGTPRSSFRGLGRPSTCRAADRLEGRPRAGVEASRGGEFSAGKC